VVTMMLKSDGSLRQDLVSRLLPGVSKLPRRGLAIFPPKIAGRIETDYSSMGHLLDICQCGLHVTAFTRSLRMWEVPLHDDRDPGRQPPRRPSPRLCV
jgi:hypothetical protein